MEPLQHRTTILLAESVYERLVGLARGRGVSMGQLVRDAVVAHYGLYDTDTRVNAVRALGQLALPVDTPAAMKAESIAYGDGPLP